MDLGRGRSDFERVAEKPVNGEGDNAVAVAQKSAGRTIDESG